MRVLGVAMLAALAAVGCGGALPLTSDVPVSPVDATQLKATPAPAPRVCAVDQVLLEVQKSKLYRRAYRIDAQYLSTGADVNCAPPAWSLMERFGEIIPTKDPFVVHVRSIQTDVLVTIVATAPNGRTGIRELKF